MTATDPKHPRVLMLGWEFPPFITGGLGTACHGLTQALSQAGVPITFVLPTAVEPGQASHVNLLGAEPPAPLPSPTRDMPGVTFKTVPAQFRSPYPAATQPMTPHAIHASSNPPAIGYHSDLVDQSRRYAQRCLALARDLDFDLIHAHDWLTYAGGVAIMGATGKPLIAHVHSTEFDRSGNEGQPAIIAAEQRGLRAATRVICVSHMTARQVAYRYDVPADRIDVVHNGIASRPNQELLSSRRHDKIVLFMGRITMQKGPEYFVDAARKVLEQDENVTFLVAGTGDQMANTIEQVAQSNIGHKVLFTGFLEPEQVQQVLGMADVFVMPSVSEPFGIAALEAVDRGVPVIVSKTAGVSEVVRHLLKVDFWDIHDMANKILGVLRHPPLGQTMARHAKRELVGLTWEHAAQNCLAVYQHALDD